MNKTFPLDACYHNKTSQIYFHIRIQTNNTWFHSIFHSLIKIQWKKLETYHLVCLKGQNPKTWVTWWTIWNKHLFRQLSYKKLNHYNHQHKTQLVQAKNRKLFVKWVVTFWNQGSRLPYQICQKFLLWKTHIMKNS